MSYVVGPKGHVYLLNNIAYDNWSQGDWQKRIVAGCRTSSTCRCDAEHLGLADRSVDAMVLSKVYHDLYWMDPDRRTSGRPIDVPKVLGEIARIVKPGGILVLIDHSAKPGTGS